MFLFSVSSYLSRRKNKRSRRRRAENWELTETRRIIPEDTDVTDTSEMTSHMTSHVMDPALLASRLTSGPPRDISQPQRLGLWGRLSRSVSSLASSGGVLESPGAARRNGSKWTMDSCELEWDAEGTGLCPRSVAQSEPDQMSCGDVTVPSQRQSPVASLDWDSQLDTGPLLAGAEPPLPQPASCGRMTTSDVDNGNFAGDVMSDDETEQLIGQIEAMTQRTLAETGSVIGFIDET
ncbi:uncharacterized protein LOC122367914 [Amphibalanus amphitrite]|uniref:uncharacterized protein LOC122367914 n=1 Tax=Amphibalanus amphitrite TaxID=1232801 RepID=UPI001C8FC27C|nr:uncharacterized protein LOC122367914 [Amphibalanus amphitrite]